MLKQGHGPCPAGFHCIPQSWSQSLSLFWNWSTLAIFNSTLPSKIFWRGKSPCDKTSKDALSSDKLEGWVTLGS